MRIISFIEDPKVIDRIIRHLELTFEAERPPPPHHVQQELLMAAEGMGGIFLRACAAAFCSFEGRVYLIAEFFAYFVVFVFCLILDLIFFL